MWIALVNCIYLECGSSSSSDVSVEITQTKCCNLLSFSLHAPFRPMCVLGLLLMIIWLSCKLYYFLISLTTRRYPLYQSIAYHLAQDHHHINTA